MKAASTSDFAAALYQAAAELHLDEAMGNFLSQLALAAENPDTLHDFVDRCSPQLARLGEAYQEAATKAKGMLPARVVSAAPLDEQRQQALTQALSRRFGKPVQCRFQVDSSLLGGVVTYIDDLVIDGSLSRQLESLREQLIQEDRA